MSKNRTEWDISKEISDSIAYCLKIMKEENSSSREYHVVELANTIKNNNFVLSRKDYERELSIEEKVIVFANRFISGHMDAVTLEYSIAEAIADEKWIEDRDKYGFIDIEESEIKTCIKLCHKMKIGYAYRFTHRKLCHEFVAYQK